MAKTLSRYENFPFDFADQCTRDLMNKIETEITAHARRTGSDPTPYLEIVRKNARRKLLAIERASKDPQWVAVAA